MIMVCSYVGFFFKIFFLIVFSGVAFKDEWMWQVQWRRFKEHRASERHHSNPSAKFAVEKSVVESEWGGPCWRWVTKYRPKGTLVYL